MQRVTGEFTPGFRSVLGNTAWLMVDRVVRMGLGLVVGVWIARYLGPPGFGILNFALSFVALFTTMSTLGLDTILVRHFITDEDAKNELLGTAVVLRLFGAMLVPVTAVACICLIEPHDPLTILLIAILSVGSLFQSFDAIDVYFQSRVQSKLTVWAKSLAFLLTAALRALLIHVRAPLWSFAAAQLAELSLGALGLVLLYQWRGGHIMAWRPGKRRALQLLSESWPVMLTGMAIMVYSRIDMVMLKLMQGDAAVGLYATATRISEVWYFVPVAIVSSVAPAVIRVKDQPRIFYERLHRLFSLMSLIALILGTGIALGSNWIVHFLYTDAFRAAGPVLAVHVWASVFVFLGVAQGPWNVAQNLLKLGFYRTLAGAICNVVLNLALIPTLSAMGAAIATVISYAIAGVFANAFDARTRPIFVMQVRSMFPGSLFMTHRSVN